MTNYAARGSIERRIEAQRQYAEAFRTKAREARAEAAQHDAQAEEDDRLADEWEVILKLIDRESAETA